MTIQSRLRRGPLNRVAAVCSATVALMLLSQPASIYAQTSPPATAASSAPKGPPPAGLGRIEGTVYDSLTKRWLPGASVWIPGTTYSATADEKGYFVLDSIPPGRKVLAYSDAAFDSAGLGSLGAKVEVIAGANAQIILTSPSLKTLWRVLCFGKAPLGVDSGIVYGTVRDGATQARLAKAPTIFRWLDVSRARRKLDLDETTNRVETDTSGTYYACGLPLNVAFNVRAFGNSAASGDIEYSLGVRGVTRMDFVVSPELRNLENKRGTATLHGVVKDVKGEAVAGAIVTAAMADTSVRTDEAGEFTMHRLPAGTQGIQVRKIGQGLANKLVDMRAGTTTEVSVVMPPARTLATFNVRATKEQTVTEAEFEDRRKLGMSTVIDMAARQFPTPIDALSNIVRVTLKYGRGGTTPTITMLNGNRSCTPGLFLDGVATDIDFMMTYPNERIHYVEVFNSLFFLPAQYIRSLNDPCGAVLFWTYTKVK